MFPNGPSASLGNFIQMIIVVLAIVRLPQSADSDFDEGATGFGFVVTQRTELIDRTRDGAARAGDDLRLPINKIMNGGVHLVKPRPVVVVPLRLQTVDHARPIKPPAAIKPPLRLGQIDLGPNQTIRELSAGGTHRSHSERHSKDER